MNIKKIKTIFATLSVSATPIYLVACGQQETISKVSLQNVTSTSAQLILSNVSKVEVGGKEDFGKFEVQLRTKDGEYKSMPITNQLIGHKERQVIITIDNLKPNTEYAARIFQQLPTEKKELFFSNHSFTTSQAPQITSFKIVPVTDTSSQYSFDATVTDNALKNKPVEVRIAKSNELSSDKYIKQTFFDNQKNDGLLHINLTNLDRNTNYQIIGFYDSQGNRIRFESNAVLNFKTNADVIDLKLLAPNPDESAIDSQLKNIKQYFAVKFAPGVANSSNVFNYKLIFKAKTKPQAPEYIKNNQNKDQTYEATFSRTDTNTGEQIFVANFPWRSDYYFFLTSVHNQLISNSNQFDPDNGNGTNSLQINPAILKTPFQINNPESN